MKPENLLPSCPGVYLMRDSSFDIIYVGKAKNLKKRVAQYFGAAAEKSWKTANLKLLVKKVDFIPCESEREALILERELIKSRQPFFNSLWKDSKSYPLVKITREDFPRILLTRKKTSDKALYFGPYPKAELIKKILSYLRRSGLIRLRLCKFAFSKNKPLSPEKIKRCLYYHTGQCPAPCDPLKITHEKYLLFVKTAAEFFSGKRLKLSSTLEKNMRFFSKIKKYEKAAYYRDCLKALAHISEKVIVSEIDRHALAARFKKADAMLELQKNLNLASPPVHIEGFDTSSLFGKYAIGSSVCFVNGSPNSTHYRHYKIRLENPASGSDDFRMIYEIVARRLRAMKISKEKLPELLLIDGGKGQLSMALKAASGLKLKLPIISLAKQNEEIYLPDKQEPLILARDNPGLQLLQRVRDEAHRFGITFHKRLRDKDLFV